MVKFGNGKLGSVLNEFLFNSVSGILSLEATNTPGTELVLGLNLTGNVYFFKREYFLST